MILNTIIIISALFGVLTSASCNGDNCLNAFVNHISSASAFCSTFLPNPVASPSIPAFASPCLDSTSRLSSACSCIVTTASTGPTTTPPPPTSCPTVTISISPTACPQPPVTTTCPSLVPPSTITVTSISTTTISTCSSSSSTAPPCSCTSLIPNPSFEDPTVAPWEIISNDPSAHWSLSPSGDMPINAYDGQWALEFSWPSGTAPTQEVGIYQNVPIPSCCIGPYLTLNFALLTIANTCTVSLYWNVITPAQPSGQIGNIPEEEFTISGQASWQTFSNSWSFEAQQNFELEILLACTNNAPVWIDWVTLGV